MPMADRPVNAARCLECGDIVVSRRRHDFVTCLCGALSVDGGADYAKRSYRPGASWIDIRTESQLLAAMREDTDAEEEYK
jgi:hypothetical protein